MDATILVRGLLAIVAILGSLLVIQLLSSTGRAVETEELNQTKQGETD